MIFRSLFPSRESPDLMYLAVGLSASAWIESVQASDKSRINRATAIGDFMLSSAITCQEVSIEEWEPLCELVISDLGISADAVRSQMDIIRSRNVQRYVFSLAYLGDKSVPGVKHNRKSSYIDSEVDFLRGVVQRHQLM